jgi:trk system potassium uptake protein TrkA
MHIVIAGGGRLGFHLAKILEEDFHDVVIIERNGDVCYELGRELKAVIVRGDATKPNVLTEARAEKADALIALTGNDDSNIVICLTSKRMGTKTVASRLANVHYDEEMLRQLGIDLVVYPEAASAAYISELVTKPQILDVAFISRGSAEIIEVQVKPGSQAINKKVAELEDPKGTAIVALYEGDELRIPQPDYRIREGDRLVLFGKTGRIKNLKQITGE